MSRILLVDDNATFRAVIEHVLSTHGYEVTAVSGGYAAIEELQKRDFALVLTDLVMDQGTGFELLATLHREWPETIVIAMSGYRDSVVIDSAAGLGAHLSLVKPFPMHKLIEHIERLLFNPANTAAVDNDKHCDVADPPKAEPN